MEAVRQNQNKENLDFILANITKENIFVETIPKNAAFAKKNHLVQKEQYQKFQQDTQNKGLYQVDYNDQYGILIFALKSELNILDSQLNELKKINLQIDLEGILFNFDQKFLAVYSHNIVQVHQFSSLLQGQNKPIFEKNIKNQQIKNIQWGINQNQNMTLGVLTKNGHLSIMDVEKKTEKLLELSVIHAFCFTQQSGLITVDEIKLEDPQFYLTSYNIVNNVETQQINQIYLYKKEHNEEQGITNSFWQDDIKYIAEICKNNYIIVISSKENPSEVTYHVIEADFSKKIQVDQIKNLSFSTETEGDTFFYKEHQDIQNPSFQLKHIYDENVETLFLENNFNKDSLIALKFDRTKQQYELIENQKHEELFPSNMSDNKIGFFKISRNPDQTDQNYLFINIEKMNFESKVYPKQNSLVRVNSMGGNIQRFFILNPNNEFNIMDRQQATNYFKQQNIQYKEQIQPYEKLKDSISGQGNNFNQLFGNFGQNKQPSGQGLFFQNDNNQQQKPAQSQNNPGFGLFGQKDNKQENVFNKQNNTQGAGIFGQNDKKQENVLNQQNNMQSGGLFGQKDNKQDNLFNQQKDMSGGGLFGQKDNKQESVFNSQNSVQSSSLFGQKDKQQNSFIQQQSTQGSGLFGQNDKKQENLFSQQNNTQSGGLFMQNDKKQENSFVQQKNSRNSLFDQNIAKQQQNNMFLQQQNKQTGNQFGQSNQKQENLFFKQNEAKQGNQVIADKEEQKQNERVIKQQSDLSLPEEFNTIVQYQTEDIPEEEQKYEQKIHFKDDKKEKPFKLLLSQKQAFHALNLKNDDKQKKYLENLGLNATKFIEKYGVLLACNLQTLQIFQVSDGKQLFEKQFEQEIQGIQINLQQNLIAVQFDKEVQIFSVQDILTNNFKNIKSQKFDKSISNLIFSKNSCPFEKDKIFNPFLIVQFEDKSCKIMINFLKNTGNYLIKNLNEEFVSINTSISGVIIIVKTLETEEDHYIKSLKITENYEFEVIKEKQVIQANEDEAEEGDFIVNLDGWASNILFIDEFAPNQWVIAIQEPLDNEFLITIFQQDFSKKDSKARILVDSKDQDGDKETFFFTQLQKKQINFDKKIQFTAKYDQSLKLLTLDFNQNQSILLAFQRHGNQFYYTQSEGEELEYSTDAGPQSKIGSFLVERNHEIEQPKTVEIENNGSIEISNFTQQYVRINIDGTIKRFFILQQNNIFPKLNDSDEKKAQQQYTLKNPEQLPKQKQIQSQSQPQSQPQTQPFVFNNTTVQKPQIQQQQQIQTQKQPNMFNKQASQNLQTNNNSQIKNVQMPVQQNKQSENLKEYKNEEEKKKKEEEKEVDLSLQDQKKISLRKDMYQEILNFEPLRYRVGFAPSDLQKKISSFQFLPLVVLNQIQHKMFYNHKLIIDNSKVVNNTEKFELQFKNQETVLKHFQNVLKQTNQYQKLMGQNNTQFFTEILNIFNGNDFIKFKKLNDLQEQLRFIQRHQNELFFLLDAYKKRNIKKSNLSQRSKLSNTEIMKQIQLRKKTKNQLEQALSDLGQNLQFISTTLPKNIHDYYQEQLIKTNEKYSGKIMVQQYQTRSYQNMQEIIVYSVNKYLLPNDVIVPIPTFQLQDEKLVQQNYSESQLFYQPSIKQGSQLKSNSMMPVIGSHNNQRSSMQTFYFQRFLYKIFKEIIIQIRIVVV
ncbi:hypothetical protein PPERSA_00887 [Pseudocohnilembus persalinus]|uniref:Uncharacterized protein n=1 Tax=Pseudocohnilembus persalinus TaxID=266149 RepID=A0A0V0QEP2_PSEPJ|nr:hypothetical protein PPERSA_00887 [Pseudocohnilembus persalinus]|eukprot:KRX00660.1 hypothetical protein PPERSA_00887 [Pseudocohnilembus persalinus]